MKRSPSRVVELQTTEAKARITDAAPQDVSESPMYGVAMLKIAMELKRAPQIELDSIVSGVLQRMRLDEGNFRRFLEQNGGLLRTIAQKREY